MGETIPTWKPTCNPSVSVRLSGRKNSSDGGAFLLREVMDRSGLCERLDQQLTDSRDPARIRHSLSSQVRTLLKEGLLDMAMWRLSSLRDGKPLSSITLDIDGLPIETFGSQSGTAYNPYVGYRHYSPLVASIAETGDMIGGLLREGNSGNATHADQWIPQLVQRIRQTTGSNVQVRFDAGFTGDATLSALDAEAIPFVGRLGSRQ